MHQYKKITTTNSGTVSFILDPSANRYTGLLFITDNYKKAVYCIGYRFQSSQFITKIAGDDISISINQNSGTISITISDWSHAILLADGPFS